MTYVVKVIDYLGLQTEVYRGDDPAYAIDLASMLRNEEPREVQVTIHLVKE